MYNATVLSNYPRVEVIDNVITTEIANHFIELGTNDLKRSMVIGEGSKSILDERRTSENCWIPHDRSEITYNVACKISAIVGLPVENAEPFQLIHYGVNQEYQPHFDAFDPKTDSGIFHLKRGGQRLKTALVYFNNVEEEGGTIFPELGFVVEATLGTMVIFENCYPGSTIAHPKSLHGGKPVGKGEKWAANLWFREGKFV